jgi:hypothetical protein
VVTRNGIERVLHLPLDDQEAEAFRRSGAVVRKTIESLHLPPRQRSTAEAVSSEPSTRVSTSP